MAQGRVFTIPPGARFLDTLVAALMDGRLVEGFDPADPFALADVTLYLPTRRAARAIRERFLARSGRPLLLPRIRALGDVDEDDLAPDGLDVAALPPAVSAIERQLALTKLVLGWSGALVRAAAELPDEELAAPASPADAANLAAGLGRLIDQVGADPGAWRGLRAGIPADLARYWEITLEFLAIATDAWPRHLAERGLVDPGVRRDMAIRAEAERLAAAGSPAPVIAAGSTGSAPATAALLAAIARLPNGAVILPGLDQDLDEASWAEIGPSDREPAGAGHPQFGLKLLIGQLGAARMDVVSIAEPEPDRAYRARFGSESMRPAGTTERWSDRPAMTQAEKGDALAQVGLVAAAHEREEALAVALILREAAETPGRVAALVTPDRGLARRVAVELRRWAIDVDDSAGSALATTAPGVLARLVADAALNGARAETLLALLRHPMARFGLARSDARRAAGCLERAVLRGPRNAAGIAALRRALDEKADARRSATADGRGTEAASTLSVQDWDAATGLVVQLAAALGPLEALGNGASAELPTLVGAHIEAIRAVVDGGGEASTVDEAAEILGQFLETLREGAAAGPAIGPRDYPGLFAALMAGHAVRRRGGLDPRIHIWGTLEARLQSVDVIVLGGLNEGGWPAQTRLDPLLSRPMRAALALEPPERRIGLAAHDFVQAFNQPQVWLTRAARENGEPRVASRWLQRTTAYAGEALAEAMTARGARILYLARMIDAPRQVAPAERPRPSPPLALRPRQLSATRIETLIRDPYAIHAQYVLKLRAFEPLAKLPDAAERGTLIHAILERFVRERPRGPFDAGALDRLIAIGREAFAQLADFPEVSTFWWPRFERIARWFVDAEAGRTDVVERIVEGRGRMQVTDAFAVTARADRLDRLAGGGLAIVDYKTGAPPSNDEVLSLAPQLPLEALIALEGGFDGLPAASVERLLYYHISGRVEPGEVCERGCRARATGDKPAITLPEALAMTRRRLQDLAAAFAQPDAEYVSRRVPKRGRAFAGDYDHLARVAEWSASDPDGVDVGGEA